MSDDKTKTEKKTTKPDESKKGDNVKPENQDGAPDQNAAADAQDAKQEPVTFKSTRYPQVQVQIKGRTLREGPKFVAGEYTTDDPEEIDALDSLDYTQRDDA